MLMGEIDMDTLGLTEDHAKTMDELLPGWRDMAPVEFMDAMSARAEGLASEFAGWARIVGELEGKTTETEED